MVDSNKLHEVHHSTSAGPCFESSVPMRAWVERFLEVLDCYKSDPMIATILRNKPLAHEAGALVRLYVDRKVSQSLYADRKQRGQETRKRFETAIRGLDAAAGLYRESDQDDVAASLSSLCDELRARLARCNRAFATKRHGRDRAQSTLDYCKRALEARLGSRITYSTLANLLNAGYEADGQEYESVSEDTLRKNLSHLQRNNPEWNEVISNVFPSPPRPEAETK